jgi:hypothetical protein
MHLFRNLLMFVIALVLSIQIANAGDENASYRPLFTFVRVSSVDTESPELFVKKIKQRLLAVLTKEKILEDGYPKPCVFKEQTDKSSICVPNSSLSLEDSSHLLLSAEGWSLSFRLVKFPTSRYFSKEIYLVPDGEKANLKSMANEVKGNQDNKYTRILVLDGLPTRKFDEALDKAIFEAGAERFPHF